MLASADDFVSAASAVLSRMVDMEYVATASEADEIYDSLNALGRETEIRLARLTLLFGPHSRAVRCAHDVTVHLRADTREHAQEVLVTLQRRDMDMDAVYEAKEMVESCRSFGQARLDTFIHAARREIRPPAGLRSVQRLRDLVAVKAAGTRRRVAWRLQRRSA